MELCLEHAKQKKNLSVERVADLMGLANRWTLYKWLENGRMPAILIPVFEHACGIDFISQYLAYSNHKLLIDIPTGKKASENKVNELQIAFNNAIGLLLTFYKGNSDTDKTIAALNNVMGDIAFHKTNIEKSLQPELSLFEGDDND